MGLSTRIMCRDAEGKDNSLARTSAAMSTLPTIGGRDELPSHRPGTTIAKANNVDRKTSFSSQMWTNSSRSVDIQTE